MKTKLGILCAICLSFVVMSACGGKKKASGSVDCSKTENASDPKCEGTATVGDTTVTGGINQSNTPGTVGAPTITPAAPEEPKEAPKPATAN